MANVQKTLSIMLAVLTPVAVQAETIRLTPEQAEAARDAGAARRAGSASLPPVDTALSDRRVHGEVGLTVGTGGYRSFYGAAAVPLGDDGEVMLGYDNARGRGYGYGPGRYNDACGISIEYCAQPFAGFATPRR